MFLNFNLGLRRDVCGDFYSQFLSFDSCGGLDLERKLIKFSRELFLPIEETRQSVSLI